MKQYTESEVLAFHDACIDRAPLVLTPRERCEWGRRLRDTLWDLRRVTVSTDYLYYNVVGDNELIWNATEKIATLQRYTPK